MTTGRSILFVFAHPDDESHWGSGVAIRCHDEGARTVLVTLTRGGRGTTGGLCSTEELPAVREQELREAARILKFDALELLPYLDKEVPNIPPDEIRRVLVGLIRRERPSVLVTFDPHGITFHVDHIALSRFVTEAIPAAADPRWYPELGEAYNVPRLLWTPPVMPWDKEDFPPRPGVDFLIEPRPGGPSAGRRWKRIGRSASPSTNCICSSPTASRCSASTSCVRRLAHPSPSSR